MAKDQTIEETERLVLGALLLDLGSYWRIADTLKADHFYSQQHKRLYAVLVDLAHSNRKPAMSVIAPRLVDNEDDEPAAMAMLSAMLRDAETLDAPVFDFVPDIVEASGRRRLKSLEASLGKQPKNKAVIDIVAELEEALLDIKGMASARRPRLLSEVARDVLAGASAAFQSQGQDFVVGFDTGIVGIDEIMGRLMNGDFIALMASRGDGKTALAVQIAKRASLRGPVLFCEIEMKAERVVERRIAGDSDISTEDMQTGSFDLMAYEKIEEIAAQYGKHQLYIYDEGRQTLQDIRSQALIMKRTVGLVMLIVDHLRLIKIAHNALGKNASEWAVKEYITSGVKELAKELNVPVIVLVQRTYTAQRRKDPTPQVDDAGIPSLDQDADVILAVWREATWMRMHTPEFRDEEQKTNWYGKLARIKDEANAICLKRRGGEAFKTCRLKFNGPKTQFEDV